MLREEAREVEVRDAKGMVDQGPRVPGWPCKMTITMNPNSSKDDSLVSEKNRTTSDENRRMPRRMVAGSELRRGKLRVGNGEPWLRW